MIPRASKVGITILVHPGLNIIVPISLAQSIESLVHFVVWILKRSIGIIQTSFYICLSSEIDLLLFIIILHLLWHC